MTQENSAAAPSAAAAGDLTIGADLRVHRLGFGAMRLTGPGVWGAPADRPAALRVLRRALELGVNFIDTADSYGPGMSEEIIAEALHPYPPGLVIATKGGLTRAAPVTGGAMHNRPICAPRARAVCGVCGWRGLISISCMRLIPACRSKTRSENLRACVTRARSVTSACQMSARRSSRSRSAS